jgi:LCP family protein required for cell wall assembly
MRKCILFRIKFPHNDTFDGVKKVWLVLCILSALLINISSCNFPLSTPTVTPVQDLVHNRGSPTWTPLLPSEPTAITPSPAVLTSTPPSPSQTPTFSFGTWPPPYFGNPGPAQVTAIPPAFPSLSGKETVNFLLVGSDRRALSFRTDTLVVVSFRPRDQSVSLISIPRDLYVYIPGWKMQRINTAYQQGELTGYPGGGAQLLKDTVAYNLGIHIDHIAMVEFNGFRQIVDTLGGIDVPLVCAFTDWHIIDPNKSDQIEDNWALFTLGPGVVHMDGDLALWYTRSRMRSSDFDRGRRQQEVLRAIFNQGIRLNVIPKLPELYSQLSQNFITDLSLDNLLELAPLAYNLSLPHIRSYYINKSYVQGWRTPSGAAVLLPKHNAILQLVAEAMAPPDEKETTNWNTTVEIWNSTKTQYLDALAAERLHYSGFETTLSPAEQQENEQTFLYDFTPDQDPHRSAKLLYSLGIPPTNLISSPNPNSPSAYRLILGTDFNPCFDPALLIH